MVKTLQIGILYITDNLRKGLPINYVVLNGEIVVVKDGKVMGYHRAISKKLEKGEELVYCILEVVGHDLTELDYLRLYISFVMKENESLCIILNILMNTIADVQSFMQ